MSELIEKVARALVHEAFEGAYQDDDPELPFAAKPFEPAARAAIEAVFDWMAEQEKPSASAYVDDLLRREYPWMPAEEREDRIVEFSAGHLEDAFSSGAEAMIAQLRKEALG